MRAFAQQRKAVDERVTIGVQQAFAALENWYSPDDLSRALKRVAPLVGAGQTTMAALTDAYLSRVTSFVRGESVGPVGVERSFAYTLRNGPKNLGEVYERVAAEYRWQRSKGLVDSAARSIALNRADEMVSTDLNLAYTHQMRRFNERRNVRQFRRVIGSTRPCGLCVVASDRVYHKENLLPIHARCKCSVIETTDGSDPASLINEGTLTQIYDAAGSTFAKDLLKVHVEVFDHPEIGPQLRVAGQHQRVLPAA